LQTELERLGREFITLTDRQHHVRSVQAELVRVARAKPFAIHHRAMWRMLLAERDMVIVRAASWIKGFYSKGGFLGQIAAGELIALALRWDDQEPGPWRLEAFGRLFPDATARAVPNGQDVADLRGALQRDFEPLLRDRNEWRAHPFERVATAKALDLAEVAGHLDRIHRLLADLHCLSAANHFTAWDTSADTDSAARDVVDLILCGPLGWIVDQVDARRRRDPESAPKYELRREVHYARLHAANDARGSAGEAFNANAFQEV
jgi:hypothetical protein